MELLWRPEMHAKKKEAHANEDQGAETRQTPPNPTEPTNNPPRPTTTRHNPTKPAETR